MGDFVGVLSELAVRERNKLDAGLEETLSFRSPTLASTPGAPPAAIIRTGVLARDPAAKLIGVRGW